MAIATGFVALVSSACGGAEVAGAPGRFDSPSSGAGDVSSGADVERFFPLVDGNLYHYMTSDDSGPKGLLVARVHRASAERGELRFPSGARTFEYAPDGVRLVPAAGRQVESGYVLKTPVQLGAKWRGEHGGETRVAGVDVAIDVPAGHFTGCVQTLEERRGDRPVRYATTFCPETGIVLLEVQGGDNIERAELKSYGPPVAIGPDGLYRVP